MSTPDCYSYAVTIGYFRHPDFPGDGSTRECGFRWHVHGWIDRFGLTVCPSQQGPFTCVP